MRCLLLVGSFGFLFFFCFLFFIFFFYHLSCLLPSSSLSSSPHNSVNILFISVLWICLLKLCKIKVTNKETSPPPFLFSLQMRWVGKGDKCQGHDDLNIDVPWANRKGRVADSCLVISFIFRADIVKTILCRSLENLHLSQCEAAEGPCSGHTSCFSHQERSHVILDLPVALLDFHQPCCLLLCLFFPQRRGSYQILYLKRESWKSWPLPARNDRLANW